MQKSQLAALPWLAVRHNPAILKQVLIEPNTAAPIIQFARAVFPPGSTAPGHIHDNMLEVFYIESGYGTMTVDGKIESAAAGDCFTIKAGEDHELTNNGDVDLCVLVFGVLQS